MSLYEKIGGEANIQLMVTAFYQRVLADPILAPFFDGIAIEKLEEMQVAFFSIALGGDEPREMPSLRSAHANRGIGPKHLARFTELLVDTLGEVGIEEAEAKRVYERIASYSDDILGEATVDG